MNIKIVTILLAALIVVSVDAGLLDAIKNLKVFRHLKHKSNGTKENESESTYHARINAKDSLNDENDWITVQSPIALSLHKSKFVKRDFEPLKFHGHWEREGEAFIEDTGSSAKITFQGRHERPFISGGLLNSGEVYIFVTE
ncbi:uncharacterized protein LOC116350400 [Contarinia nasturtii]|uniref:uncharacterized protein LOC116350400 n=1 Tax=Contarinia nasturtii TaxID=265458 RepID=UPI0012D3A06B|nr:uncharacterized protein LOC116350400 [Contarinia nasturtii]